MSTSGSDIFVFVDGVRGDSLDSKHRDCIDTLAFGWAGVSTTVSSSSGGGGSGKSQVGPFCFVKTLDGASTQLLKIATQGEHIKQVLVTFRKAGGKGDLEYLKYTFEDVFVSSVQPGAAGAVPGEEVTLNFARATVEFCPQLANGSQGACQTVAIDATGSKAP